MSVRVALLMIGCAFMGCSQYDAVQSLRDALDGHPDGETVKVMRVLEDSLSETDKLYLMHMDWSGHAIEDLLSDPAVTRAIWYAYETRNPAASQALRSALLSPQASAPNPTPGAGINYPAMQNFVSQGVQVMEWKNGVARLLSPAPVAAQANGLARTMQTTATGQVGIGGAGQYADANAHVCVLEFKKGTPPSGECRAYDFCSRSRLDFNQNPPEYICWDKIPDGGVPPDGGGGDGGGGTCDPCGLAGHQFLMACSASSCGINSFSAYSALDISQHIPQQYRCTGGQWSCAPFSCSFDVSTCRFRRASGTATAGCVDGMVQEYDLGNVTLISVMQYEDNTSPCHRCEIKSHCTLTRTP